jgi:hypothetical protein
LPGRAVPAFYPDLIEILNFGEFSFWGKFYFGGKFYLGEKILGGGRFLNKEDYK